MEDAVHGAACALNRFLKRIHGSHDVLLKWVRYKNVILSRVAVIGTSAGEIEDPILYVIAAASPRRGSGWCSPGRRLLSEKNRCASEGSHHCREFIEVSAPSIDLHKTLHSTSKNLGSDRSWRSSDAWNMFITSGMR